jgi:hypothetical protein
VSKPSPTQRSVALLKERGYLTAIVEKFNPHVGPYGIRQDLFGFGDILALRKDEILLVQTTSGSNVSKRIDKIACSDLYPRVVESGMRVCVHGWRKLKAGWACREVDL